MENEIWKPVAGYEGRYEVSNLGRIKGFSKGTIILKGEVGYKGKTRYSLEGKKVFGHILVAKAFTEICGVWFEGCQVHHKDQNPANNRADNLICLSAKEHRKIHTELGSHKGIHNGFYGKEWTDNQRNTKRGKAIIQYDLEDNYPIAIWDNALKCEKFTGINHYSISANLIGKKKTAYGYRFEYQ